MIFLIFLLFGIIIVNLLLTLVLLWCWKFRQKPAVLSHSKLPKLSVLIAARNEEKHIDSCLTSLTSLQYPKDKIEVLVGNDGSNDQTLSKIRSYTGPNSNIQAYDIHEQVGEARAKANVLAQLAKKATGEYFLVTDGDVKVLPGWANYMIEHRGAASLVNGTTIIEGDSLLQRLQNIEWLYAQALIKIITDTGIPITAMGNNMLIARLAYKQVGGYESLPSSVTEDHELFIHMRKQGQQVINLFEKGALVTTDGQKTFSSLLHQRKRWIKGVIQLPVWLLFILFMQTLFLPSIILLSVFLPELAISFFLTKEIFQGLLIYQIFQKLDQKVKLVDILWYEFYGAVLWLVSIIFYLLPIKINWKGRLY
ncbi:MAG: glycosyltransferase [Bacteroidetes bacterium]|nr:glycosyltransferase [Bacteroidota bacterium]